MTAEFPLESDVRVGEAGWRFTTAALAVHGIHVAGEKEPVHTHCEICEHFGHRQHLIVVGPVIVQLLSTEGYDEYAVVDRRDAALLGRIGDVPDEVSGDENRTWCAQRGSWSSPYAPDMLTALQMLVLNAGR